MGRLRKNESGYYSVFLSSGEVLTLKCEGFKVDDSWLTLYEGGYEVLRLSQAHVVFFGEASQSSIERAERDDDGPVPGTGNVLSKLADGGYL